MRTSIRSVHALVPAVRVLPTSPGELNGEKIDIIKWNEDMAQFVSAALAPADVINATMQADNKSCVSSFPDDQLSLAIGKEGQNARLAAKLTGCKIDIAPESQGE